jgi:hypothetical protein
MHRFVRLVWIILVALSLGDPIQARSQSVDGCQIEPPESVIDVEAFDLGRTEGGLDAASPLAPTDTRLVVFEGFLRGT